jgi:hypothetical protein
MTATFIQTRDAEINTIEGIALRRLYESLGFQVGNEMRIKL